MIPPEGEDGIRFRYRGGSFKGMDPLNFRSSHKYHLPPEVSILTVGFRGFRTLFTPSDAE